MLTRRKFIQSIPLAALSVGTLSISSNAAAKENAAHSGSVDVTKLVALTGDNVPVHIEHYPEYLEQLLKATSDVDDFYLENGAVSALEKQFAKLLGKQDAAFFPTGTMANQVAIRLLCGDNKHLLLQEESHIYRDEGDAASMLSELNPVPLHAGVDDTLYEAVVSAFNQSSEDAYPIVTGAVSLESPVRRLDGAAIPYEVAQRISSFVKSKGAKMHLDGARLLLTSGNKDFEVKRFCTLFDTVYVSLYKYLGAPFGAILAGDSALVDKARKLRHVFGGNIFHGWVAAAPASSNLHGFVDRFKRARERGETLLRLLAEVPGIRVTRVPYGTNVAFVEIDARIEHQLVERLRLKNIIIRPAVDGRLRITINETILRMQPEFIANAFVPRGQAK